MRRSITRSLRHGTAISKRSTNLKEQGGALLTLFSLLKKDMKHLSLKPLSIITLCAVSALCGCAGDPFSIFDIFSNTTSPVEYNTASIDSGSAIDSFNLNHWFTIPQSGRLVIIGVSGRQINRETEIEFAKEDAARKVSMFYGVYVIAQNVHSVGSGFLDYYEDFYAEMAYDQQIEKYIDRLVFDPEQDVFNGDGYLLVWFTYPANFPGAIAYSPASGNANSRPEWINRPPASTGNYIIGVGFANRQLRFRDTIIKSYESAAVALVSQISSSVTTGTLSDSSAYQNTETIYQYSEGALSNFVVLETWIDPDSRAAWTLAIAEKP